MIRLNAIENPPSGGVNVTPLVDVIFILLIFFLLTANPSQGIVLDLPGADTAEAIPTETWEISITVDSQVLFNGVEVEAGNLYSVLEAARQRAPEFHLVVLRADRAVTVDVFVDAMDAIRKTGFYNLVIATAPKSTADERNKH
ncbi:MAG: biopolymer transporter ExbD [Woeseiaceae bacterium]|nr:biopolymer transporter ExbD [Woeseiaceae bacterium]